MSSTTQCPACGTSFKVVVDQLQSTKGWVRCGQCQEVFDAQSHMPEVLAAKKPDHGLQISFNDDPNVAPITQAYAAKPAAPVDVAAKKKDFSSSDWIDSVNPPAPAQREPSSAKKPSLGRRSDFRNSEQIYERWASSAADSVGGYSKPAPVDTPEPAPSFVVQAQRKQFWSAPWVRTSMGLLGFVLLSTLGLQVLRHERDRIAAALPAVQPLLQTLCSMSGCTVGPLKQIDAVVVDASSFNKLRNEGGSEQYKLGLSLKNNGHLPVAMPHVELTLNDAQDLPLLRRVLSPTDFGSAQNVLAPVTEFAGGSTIAVDAKQLAGGRIAGYRVWAFYP
jgi:predicted Zn finger-like uncharacterized protein